MSTKPDPPKIRTSFDYRQKDGKPFRALLVIANEFESQAFFFAKIDFPEVAEQLRNAAAALEKANSE